MRHRARARRTSLSSFYPASQQSGRARWTSLLTALFGLALVAAPGAAAAEETIEGATPAMKGHGDEARARLHGARAAIRARKDKDKSPGKEAAPAAAAPAATADALAPELRGDTEQAIDAVQKLAALDSPRAVEVLLDNLAVGMPPKVASAALEVVGAKKAPQSMEVLRVYANHRNPELRKKALIGLGKLGEKSVVPQLIAALSDSSADVRAAAAQALGERGEKSAEPQLIKLLLRKDAAAPAALGKIGGPETARALGEMVGNVPDRLLVETLGELLRRPDFGPDPLRLEVVKTLGKLPGADPLDVLTDYVKDTAKDKLRPSRIEAGKIIEQRTAK